MTTEDAYSAALDEIFRLRVILAYEAKVTAAHLSLKTFPKSRREAADRQIERMTAAATGQSHAAYGQIAYPKRALSAVGASECLTRDDWERQAQTNVRPSR
jgi:hypothetical protein